MKNKIQTSPLLLRWSEHIQSSDVQDPLGLGLRGSTRLASRLLYCITSITPRARYFSFIPWCIFNYGQVEKGKPYAVGLREGIIIREQAFTLACIAHHEGEPCSGGALVGTREAKKWYEKGGKEANFKRLKKFSKNPALGAYLNSLVNLGMFLTEDERPDSDEEEVEEELSFDDIQLSALGVDLARSFDQKVGSLVVTKQIASRDRTCSLVDLADFGKHVGLCELPNKGATDRALLRDIFFAVVKTEGPSHQIRRQSLLLMLELCRQFSDENWVLDEPGFAGAVYFGEVASDGSHLAVVMPPKLLDIATRWRMFYFHHYMSVALEGLFSWLTSQLGSYGLSGTKVDALVAQLTEPTVLKNLSEIFSIALKGSFGDLTPSALFAEAGISGDGLDENLSKSIDSIVTSQTPFSESELEYLIRSKDHLYSSTGLALSMTLLSVTLARYSRWEGTNYGKWLASAANDSYLDLLPPLLITGLARRFGDWWNTSFNELTGFVLSRYVVQQHQSMSYEKTSKGERCLLQVDGERVIAVGGYHKIGMGNPRLRSSMQILMDLGLIEGDEDGVNRLTSEGEAFLKRELAKEPTHEIS